MSNPVLLNEPEVAHAVTLVLAHGAGAPMDSPFMEELAGQLASHGLRVLRFEFPYMAARRADGRKRPPNPMAVLQASLRELCSTIDAPFFLAGKSMGGRVASMMAAELEAQGFICFGYPFHPPGKLEKTRIEHLRQVTLPGLIIQGTRDPFGKPQEIEGYPLDPDLQVRWLEGGDHDLTPLKRSGLTQSNLIAQAARYAAEFCRQHA